MKTIQKNILRIYLLSLTAKILYFASHVPFAQDQVRDVVFIQNLIQNYTLYIPFGPATSVGSFFLPPVYYYLHLIAQLLFFQNFYAMDFLVIILESFTPVVIFLLAYKITKNQVNAFGTSLIYLFSFGVLAAANAWNPNLVPLFSILFIFGFITYFIEKNTIWLTTALISFTVLLHLHFQWFLLAPLFLVLFVSALVQYKKTAKYLGIFLVASSIIFAPYLFSELESGFKNTKTATQTIFSAEERVYERVRKPMYLAVFFPNYYQRMLVGNLFISSWDKQYEVVQPAMVVGSLIFFTSFALSLVFAKTQYAKHKNAYLLLYLGIFIFIFFFLRIYTGDKPDYYIYVVSSYASILLGTTVHFLTQNKSRGFKILLFVFILSVQAAAILHAPSRNSYTAYQKITQKIEQLSQNHLVVVEPTNQELVIPLQYFLKSDYFAIEKKKSTEYYVLVCYKTQECHNYIPNETVENNFFKYDHITPVDFSYAWQDYSPELKKESFVIEQGHLLAYFIKVRE